MIAAVHQFAQSARSDSGSSRLGFSSGIASAASAKKMLYMVSGCTTLTNIIIYSFLDERWNRGHDLTPSEFGEGPQLGASRSYAAPLSVPGCDRPETACDSSRSPPASHLSVEAVIEGLRVCSRATRCLESLEGTSPIGAAIRAGPSPSSIPDQQRLPVGGVVALANAMGVWPESPCSAITRRIRPML